MNPELREDDRIPSVNADAISGCVASTGNQLGCRLPVDPGLEDQGWEWRCNADGPKLDQMIETYRELGFEVRVEALALNGLSENCIGCKDSLEQSLAVLVRRPDRS